MSTKSHEDLIKLFIKSVKEKYSDLIIKYTYDEDSDMYDIWHNNKVLQFESKSFLEFVGCNMKEILYDNGLYNFSFGYDYLQAKKLEPNYTLQKNSIVYTEPNIMVGKTTASINKFSYSTNLEKEILSNVAPNFTFNSSKGICTFKFYGGTQDIVLHEPAHQLAHTKDQKQEMGLAA